MKITIQIEPMGAVRMTQRGKFVKPLAQRYLNYKKLIGYAARAEFETPVEHPVQVTLEFTYPIPESWAKWKKAKALSGDLLPNVKPDIDNVIKGCFDALNKIAWKDDNQVVGVQASKKYGENPQIDITITEVPA